MLEPANSANFTIAALLGSARPQQELIRESTVFHDQSLHGSTDHRSGFRSMIESDEEDDQETGIQGKTLIYFHV